MQEGAMHMTARIEGASRAPWWVTTFGPIAKSLLAAGVPLGFNGLITVPGRTTGMPRTTPVAIIVDGSGRRWIWAPWGDVQWVRNLRAAGRATITVRGRREEVTAIEQDRDQRLVFFRDTCRRSPGASRSVSASSGSSTGRTSRTQWPPPTAARSSSSGRPSDGAAAASGRRRSHAPRSGRSGRSRRRPGAIRRPPGTARPARAGSGRGPAAAATGRTGRGRARRASGGRR